MVYVLVITLLLSGAALAAEYAARLRHSARSRWIWALTIVASLIIPTLIASVSIQVPSLLTPTVARKAIPLRELTTLKVVPLTWVHEHTRNVVAANNENQTLQRAWMIVSVALLGALVLNGAQVFWRKRRWKPDTVAGVSVVLMPWNLPLWCSCTVCAMRSKSIAMPGFSRAVWIPGNTGRC